MAERSKTTLLTTAVALILASIAALAIISPAASPAAAQDAAPFTCDANAGTVTWSGGPSDIDTYWVYRSTGTTFQWLGRGSADGVIVDPAPRVGALYQVGSLDNGRTNCQTSAEPPAANCQSGPIEAEDALLAGRFITDTDTQASGGAYAHVPRGTGGEWNGTRTNFIEFCVTVPTDRDYQIDATILAPSDVKRSFYVTVDDGQFVEFVAPAVPDVYQTVRVNDAGYLDPLNATRRVADPAVKWFLTEGDHYVRFYLRRDGTRLDKVAVIPADTSVPPAPPAPVGSAEADQQAVRAIYEANGLTVPSSDVCRISGVIRCSSSTGRVTGLFLDSLALAVLPPEIGNLTDLSVLSAKNNELVELPPEIGNLTDLLTLNVTSNNLTELPPEITNLARLKFLGLSRNQFAEVPPDILDMRQIKALRIDYNQLTALPTELTNLTGLNALSVAGNQLTELPAGFGNLTNLIWLYLHNNQLTELPADFGNHARLEILYLNGNQLTELPADIANFRLLEKLVVHSNQLTQLPPNLATLDRLEFLDVDRNLLTELPADIADLTSLRTLYAKNNQLSDIPELPASLKTLYLNNNNLTTVPAAVTTLANLNDLDLANNEIRGDITPLASLLDRDITISIGDGDVASTLGPADVGNDCMTTTSTELAAYLDATDPEWSLCDTP